MAPSSPSRAADTDIRLIVGATEIILGELPRRLRIEDAAEDLGVRRLEIEAAFARVNTGLRPFVRVVRLFRLRDFLRAGAAPDVESALVRWGFARRSGDVAADYLFLFGETPEATLTAARPGGSPRDDLWTARGGPVSAVAMFAGLSRQLPSVGGNRRSAALAPRGPAPSWIGDAATPALARAFR